MTTTLIGIVSKVFDDDKLVEETISLAQEISKYSLASLMACKEAISKSKCISYNASINIHYLGEDLPLSLGVDYERKLFHSTFALVFKMTASNRFLTFIG